MGSLRSLGPYPLWCVAQRNWFNRIDSLASPFLSFLNVRYALHDPRGTALPPQWRVVGEAGRLEIVENSAVLPRAFMPAAVRMNVPYPAVIDEMRNAKDFRALSWINQHGAPSVTSNNGSGNVAMERTSLSSYAIHADVAADGWVVISQAAWKGWKAFEGRREIPVRVANHAFLAIHLPRGHHDVSLEFRPQGFIVGRALTCLSLVGIILIGLWSARSV